jgi:hypothetical protein
MFPWQHELDLPKCTNGYLKIPTNDSRSFTKKVNILSDGEDKEQSIYVVRSLGKINGGLKIEDVADGADDSESQIL